MRWSFQYELGSDKEAYLESRDGDLDFSMNLLTLYWRRRLLQRKCPNCGKEFGHLWGTDQRTVVSGRCPQCDYKPVT